MLTVTASIFLNLFLSKAEPEAEIELLFLLHKQLQFGCSIDFETVSLSFAVLQRIARNIVIINYLIKN